VRPAWRRGRRARGGGRGAAAGGLVADDAGDQRDDLGGCRRGAQAVGELLLDQARGQLGEQLEVGGVAAGGAAIRNARSAGRPWRRSPRRESRANASVGVSTPALRQCGIAMPPLSPVAAVASRARASSASWSTSVARPASRRCGQRADHVVLVGPEVGVEADQVFGDHLGHGLRLHLM
jgi:hypothetical protein